MSDSESEDRKPKKAKQLSTNVLKLKFMQRRQESELRSQLQGELEEANAAQRWLVHGGAAARLVRDGAIPAEQLGRAAVRTLGSGRRSFGNFNPAVERMEEREAQRAVEATFREDEDHAVSKEEMAERYQAYVKGVKKHGVGGKKKQRKKGAGKADTNVVSSIRDKFKKPSAAAGSGKALHGSAKVASLVFGKKKGAGKKGARR